MRKRRTPLTPQYPLHRRRRPAGMTDANWEDLLERHRADLARELHHRRPVRRIR